MKTNCEKKQLPLKNGLTVEQVEKAKETLSKVNVAKIAKEVGVKVSTLQNVLRDQSPRVGDLKKVLVVAKRELRKKEKDLVLPL